MDQQSIVLYLCRKGLSAVAIHDDLVATLGAEGVSCPSVTRYLREAIFASNPPDPLPPPEHQLNDSDQVILVARVITTHTSTKNDCPQTINAISEVSCAPSSMRTPFFVTLSEARSSEVVTTTF
jgi:hypothetical protein